MNVLSRACLRIVSANGLNAKTTKKRYIPQLLVYKSHFLYQFNTQKRGCVLYSKYNYFLVSARTVITSCHSGDLTSMLQPLDVVLNKPFNERMRQKLMDCMYTDDKELTKGGNLKRPTLSMVTTWVKEA